MTGTIFASKRLRGRDEEHSGSGDFVFFDDDGAIVERGTDIEDGLKELWGDWSVHVNATLLDDGWDFALIKEIVLLHEGDETSTLHHRHIDDGFVDGFVEIITVENHFWLDFLLSEEVFLEDTIDHVVADVVHVDEDSARDKQEDGDGTDDS